MGQWQEGCEREAVKWGRILENGATRDREDEIGALHWVAVQEVVSAIIKRLIQPRGQRPLYLRLAAGVMGAIRARLKLPRKRGLKAAA